MSEKPPMLRWAFPWELMRGSDESAVPGRLGFFTLLRVYALWLMLREVGDEGLCGTEGGENDEGAVLSAMPDVDATAEVSVAVNA